MTHRYLLQWRSRIGRFINIYVQRVLLVCMTCLPLCYWGCEIDTDNVERLDMTLDEGTEHSWSIEASFSEEGTVMSVWGATDSEEWSDLSVWAVGGQPEQGVIWSRTDGEWINVNAPMGPLLNWVHGSRGHLWVVGNEGRAMRYIDPAQGGDGEWESFNADTEQDLWGVFAQSPTEVWAVGGDPTGTGDIDPVLTRFDGNVWTRVELPSPDRSGVRALFKIYGDPLTGSLFAVGMKGVIYGDVGSGWGQLNITSATDAPPSGEDLISLWGKGDQLVAVGGRSNGVLAQWDGQEWRSSVLSGVPGLNGVWVDERGRATAVGVRGAALQVLVGSFEGERERTNTSLVLHATWGNEDEIWAVGGSLDNTPPWTGVILHSSH